MNRFITSIDGESTLPALVAQGSAANGVLFFSSLMLPSSIDRTRGSTTALQDLIGKSG
jgi:hypothetical protein